MALYSYKAQTQFGTSVSGKMSAQSEKELYDKLREEGKFLVQARVETTGSRRRKPLKAKQVAEFCRQLGTLLGSGVILIRGLRIIMEDESLSVGERAVYDDLLVSVRKGISLSEAMEEQGDVFPELLINMLRAAEVSGNLDLTCMKMAEHYTKEFKLNNKIKSALVYPKILGGITVMVLIVLMGFVVPQFESMFEQMGTLPIPTRILLAISDFVKAKWIQIIIVVVLAWISINLALRISKVAWMKDRMMVHLPLIGKLEKQIYTARFARTLSSLYAAGIPIVTTLQIAKSTIGNIYIENQFDEVIRQVRTGSTLNKALAEVDGFTNKLISSIKVGEETGQLDRMLISSADTLDYEAEMAIGRLVSYIEPAMIVVMALLVGFIIIAVITPIYGSYATLGVEAE